MNYGKDNSKSGKWEERKKTKIGSDSASMPRSPAHPDFIAVFLLLLLGTATRNNEVIKNWHL
jgi:hypothetical protein